MWGKAAIPAVVALVLVLVSCGASGDGPGSAAPASAPAAAGGLATTTPPSTRAETKKVEVGDLTFDVREQGPATGDTVILLHGFPQSGFEWRAQQDALAKAGYHTLAPDQRGYSAGARPASADAYRLDLLAGDVLGLASAFGAQRFHLVGHDWGAAVAWVVAGVAPERVRTLSIVSVPHPAAYSEAVQTPGSEQARKSGYIATFSAPGAGARMAAPGAPFLHAAFGQLLKPDEIAEYERVLGTPEAMQAALNWYVANDPRSANGRALPSTTVPTLYVYSTGDCCLGRDAADATRNHVSGPYRYEILEGVSHWVPEEAPDRLNALLLDQVRTG